MKTMFLAFFAALTSYVGIFFVPNDKYVPLPPVPAPLELHASTTSSKANTELKKLNNTTTSASEEFAEYKNLNNFTHWYGSLVDIIEGAPCRSRIRHLKGYDIYLAFNLGDTAVLPISDCVATSSYRMLNEYYTVSDESVYYTFPYLHKRSATGPGFELYVKARKLAGSDAATAVVFTNDLAKDAAHVYERGKAIEGLDGATFTALKAPEGGTGSQSYLYAKDGKGVYYITGSEVQTIVGADMSTFELIGGGYAKDSVSVYRKGERVMGADPLSFSFLSFPKDAYRFTIDKNNVYFDGRLVAGADPHTVSILSFAADCQKYCHLNEGPRLLKDKNGVYYYSYISKQFLKIEGADPVSFKPIMFESVVPRDATSTRLDVTDYARDSRNVYYYGENILADPDTFSLLTKIIAKDKINVYWYGNKLEGADPSSFALLPGSAARDKINVYWSGKTLEDADPSTFFMLNEHIGIDGHNLYFRGSLRSGIDAQTLRIVTTDSTKPLPLQSNKFTGGMYLKDNSKVYYYSAYSDTGDDWFLEVVPGADPSTAQMIGDGQLRDAQGKFNGLEKM